MFARLVLLLGLAGAACGGSGSTGPIAASPASPGEASAAQPPGADESPGAKLFATECAGCHGKHAEGIGRAAKLVGDGALSDFKTGKDLLAYVSTKMPLPKARAGKLTADQYAAVAGFLLEKNGRKP